MAIEGKEAMNASNVATIEQFSVEPTSEILSAWGVAYKSMRDEFGEGVYRSWLKPMELQAYYEGTLEISVPTRFMRDWIQEHYSGQILSLCQKQVDDIARLQFVVSCFQRPTF